MTEILIGVIAGIVAGMGIGGGTILIPALVFILGTDQKIAQSINLLAFIPTSIVALIIHYKNKNIITTIILRLIVFGAIGSIAGSFIAVYLNQAILKKIFCSFLFLMGIYELFSKKEINK